MHEEQNAAIDSILQNAGVTVTCIPTGAQKRGDWECDGWRITLTTGKNSASFDYFTGTGHRLKVRGYKAGSMPGAKFVKGYWQAEKPVAPHVAGLFYSVLLDSSASEMSFAEWCSDYGYDTDSRKALATYEACQENADKFKRIFNAAQREALAKALEDY